MFGVLGVGPMELLVLSAVCIAAIICVRGGWLPTLFSLLRLSASCFALLWGIWFSFASLPNEPDKATLRVWGLAIAAVGMAVTLQETAFILGRFVRGNDK